ncbi:MAG: ABC transporter substrate-binding protein [Clostridia bacterium]|nr:ABC transporter substrate-binding protein [Clostridia bacterium]
MNKKRLICLILSCLLVVCFFAGCSNNSGSSDSSDAADTSAEAATDNTVVIGLASDLKTLDPGHMYEIFGNMICYATYDMLFRISGDNLSDPQPSVATEDWSLDETRTVYTLPLRQDVYFTSGNQLTAKDVIFTINRVKNLKSNNTPNAEGVVSVEAPDDFTVVITLDKPDASFLTKLASNAFAVLDSEVVKEHGGTDAEDAASTDSARTWLDANSAGSGPYILESWTQGVEIVLKKNPNYWGECGNVDTFIIKEIPDSNTQIQMLERGEIDIAFTLNADNIAQLKNEDGSTKDGITIINGQTSLISFLLMNNDPTIGGPMADPRVQQAVRLAINYENLLKLCGDGATLPLSYIPLNFVGGLTRDVSYTDVDAAKALMAEAGYENGFDVVLTTADYDTEGLKWPTMAQRIASDLAEIGINVKIETGEIGVVIDAYRDGTCQFLIMHWSPDYYDINNQLAFLPDATVGARANWHAEGHEDMIALGDLITGEADPAQRAEYSRQLQELTAEDSPYAFLLQHPKNFAIGDRVDNVIYNDLVKLQLSEMNVK